MEQEQKVNASQNNTRQSSTSYNTGVTGRDQHQQQVNTSQGTRVKQQPVQSHNNTLEMNRQPLNSSQAGDVKQPPMQVRNNSSQVNQQQHPHVNAPVNNSRPREYAHPKGNVGTVDRNASVQQRGQDQQPKQNGLRKQ
jgi:hypothetical protein